MISKLFNRVSTNKNIKVVVLRFEDWSQQVDEKGRKMTEREVKDDTIPRLGVSLSRTHSL